MIWKKYRGADVQGHKQSPVKRRYSVTSDILSFKRCPRQYGFFETKGYEPAYIVQFYFGTIIHQVLDRAHSHYRGLLEPAKKGLIPSDADIEEYFREVENALKARGVKAIGSERSHALEILKLFNKIEGPVLYPRVKETEFTLQADKGWYILRGNVDVLVEATDHPATPSEVEIWDYKGQRVPDNPKVLADFDYQMNVYAELYRMRTGFAPKKAVLYFMSELDPQNPPKSRPPNAYREVLLKPETIIDAMDDFEATVHEIERCRQRNTWEAPPHDARLKWTCDVCDLRWSCDSTGAEAYPRRFP